MITFRMRSAMIAVAATAAVGVGVAPAMAAPDDTNVTVTGGSLGITDPVIGDFGGITLSGAAQDTTAAVNAFTVNDATGTGDGWKVTIQASQLAEWDGVSSAYVADGATLGLSSMSLPASTVTALNGTTSPVPTVNPGPFAIDNGAAVVVASAALDEGMGEYQFSAQTLNLSVPAHVYAKQYRSDVTLSVVTGP